MIHLALYTVLSCTLMNLMPLIFYMWDTFYTSNLNNEWDPPPSLLHTNMPNLWLHFIRQLPLQLVTLRALYGHGALTNSVLHSIFIRLEKISAFQWAHLKEMAILINLDIQNTKHVTIHRHMFNTQLTDFLPTA